MATSEYKGKGNIYIFESKFLKLFQLNPLLFSFSSHYWEFCNNTEMLLYSKYLATTQLLVVKSYQFLDKTKVRENFQEDLQVAVK